MFVILGGLRVTNIIKNHIIFRKIGWVSYTCSSSSSQVSRYSWFIFWRIMYRNIFCSTLIIINTKRNNFHEIIQNQRAGHCRFISCYRVHNLYKNAIVYTKDSKTMVLVILCVLYMLK